jgi:hypothetical protein
MPDLKVANPIKDLPILERSRQEAFALVEVDPHLRSAENRPPLDFMEYLRYVRTFCDIVETWLAAGAEREVIFMAEIRVFLSREVLELLLELLKLLLANK